MLFDNNKQQMMLNASCFYHHNNIPHISCFFKLLRNTNYLLFKILILLTKQQTNIILKVQLRRLLYFISP